MDGISQMPGDNCFTVYYLSDSDAAKMCAASYTQYSSLWNRLLNRQIDASVSVSNWFREIGIKKVLLVDSADKKVEQDFETAMRPDVFKSKWLRLHGASELR